MFQFDWMKNEMVDRSKQSDRAEYVFITWVTDWRKVIQKSYFQKSKSLLQLSEQGLNRAKLDKSFVAGAK